MGFREVIFSGNKGSTKLHSIFLWVPIRLQAVFQTLSNPNDGHEFVSKAKKVHQVFFHGLQRLPDCDGLLLHDDASLGEVEDAALKGDAVLDHD